MKKICFTIALLLLTSMPFIALANNSTLETDNASKNLASNVPMPKFSTPVTIEELRAAYLKYSAVAIVRALVKNDWENYDFIFDKVASGDEEWIHAFVTYVVPGTDAAAAEGVPVALAHALSNNTKAVLALDKNLITPSLYSICGLPFYEPEYEFIKAHGKKTLKALRQVDDPELLDARDVCIRRLQGSLGRCEKVYKEGKWNNK